MFFRRSIAVFILIAGTVMVGCAGEDDPRNDTKHLNLDQGRLSEGKCLDGFGTVVGRYVSGDLPKNELIAFWGCVDHALSLFSNYVEGRQQGVYTPGELRSYLETNFMTTTKISDQLLHSAMELKRVFVGGTSNLVKEDEISEIRKFVDLLKTQTLELFEYNYIFFDSLESGGSRGVSQVEVDQALTVFGESLDAIFNWVSAKGNGYKIDSFKALLVALKDSMDDEYKETFAEVLKFVPIAKGSLAIVFGGEGESISSGQWGGLSRILKQVMSVWLEYARNIRGVKNWIQYTGFESLDKIVGILLTVLQEAVRAHDRSMIPHEKFERLFKDAGELMSYPLGMSYEGIGQLWRALVGYGLRELSDSPPNGANIKGFGLESLEVLKKEYLFWHEIQIDLNRRLQGGPLGAASVVRPELSAGERSAALSEMNRVLAKDFQFILDPGGRLIVDPLQFGIMDHTSLLVINSQRAVIRLLIRGFSQNKDWRQQVIGVAEQDLANAARELQDLLVILGIAAPGETPEKIATNIFQLASLFMPHSRGRNYLSLQEGVEYFSVVLSGVQSGVSVVNKTREDCASGDSAIDQFSVDCYRRIFSRQFSVWAENLPQMDRYYHRLGGAGVSEFQIALEEATRSGGFSAAPITSSDINKIQVVLHYVEIFMYRFDVNRDNHISEDEAMVGFPVFKSILKKLLYEQSGKSSDKLVKGLYLWLLDEGEVPEGSDEIKFAAWSYLPRWLRSDIRPANRVQLAKVLAALAKSNR